MIENAAIVESYYRAMGNKNIDELAKYLHADVKFISPLTSASGKASFLEAVRKLAAAINNLTIRTVCSSNDHVMIAYDLHFSEPIGKVRTAALITLQNKLIMNIELFFDARPFGTK